MVRTRGRLKLALEQKDILTRRDASTIQLDVGYRGSALARDDRDETALLRATDHTLVLIRPDGYVALISDAGDVSAVSHYLAARLSRSNGRRPLSGTAETIS